MSRTSGVEKLLLFTWLVILYVKCPMFVPGNRCLGLAKCCPAHRCARHVPQDQSDAGCGWPPLRGMEQGAEPAIV